MPQFLPPKPMMKVADIAIRLALSEDHVRERLVTRADFPKPAFQIGRTRRWEAADVEQWIAARRKRITHEAA
jgi:predicted DNA-binding transcriptional regulator AlpA